MSGKHVTGIVGEAATWAGTKAEDDPVYLELKSARPVETQDDAQGSEPTFHVSVMPFNTWQFVKGKMRQHCKGFKATPDQHIRLLYKGVELKNDSMVEDYAMEGGTMASPVKIDYLVTNSQRKTGDGDIGIYLDSQVPSTRVLKERVQEVWGAMLQNIQPKLTDDGTGATYFLYDSAKKRKLAIFKPKDEEAFAPQNPRGYEGPENSVGLREGVFSTQQAAREVAAFLLDHNRFSGVPETTLVHARHPKFKKAQNQIVWKIGAFQVFVESTDTAGNYAPSAFTTTDVHRIGILDLRIVNLDRNDGNLLVIKRGDKHKPWNELVPIDHGLSLPDRLEVVTDDCCWMGWPQAKQPFDNRELATKTLKETKAGGAELYIPTKGFQAGDRLIIGDISAAHVIVFLSGEHLAVLNGGLARDIPAGTAVRLESSYAIIQSLNGERDAQYLSDKLGIRRECLRLMEVTTRLLQIGAKHGLTLYDIGTILYAERPDDDSPTPPSTLKRLIDESLDTAMAVVECHVEGPTLAGLNLDLSRREHKRWLHPVTGTGPASPSLGPSSPGSHSPMPSAAASPHLSPSPGPAGSGEGHPPPLSLDSSDNDDPAVSFNITFQTQLSPRSEDVRGLAQVQEEAEGLQALHEVAPRRRKHKSVRNTRPSAMSAPHREGKGREPVAASIFARPGIPASDWSEELESTFRRQITEAITKYIKKHFDRPKPAAVASIAPAIAADVKANDSPRDTSLASAFPVVLLPMDKDVLETAADSQSAAAAEDGVPVNWGAVPSKGKYVPRYLRNKVT